MTINTNNPEFGYELISVVPYAYYHHLRGEKVKVITGYDMEPFYYFCQTEYNQKQRGDRLPPTPNAEIHKPALDLAEFAPPPYKTIYTGKYDFDVVICNRYNNEWTYHEELNKPINYFSPELLFMMFALLSRRKVAYLNIDTAGERYYDNAPPLQMDDRKLCQRFANVTHIADIATKESFNTTQLQVMAGAKLFITLNGGYAIMASYFGGRNIIYTNPVEIDGEIFPAENQFGDFGYYHHFGGSEIINVTSEKDLLTKIIQS